MTLRLGVEINYPEMHDRPAMLALAREAEDLGYDRIWCPEVYTYDAFTTLTQIACNTERIGLGTNIAQLYARTPTLLATTAASLDQLSGGRFVLGIGASGPQVIEGWHGVPYDRPLQRTRELIQICRTVWSGERLVHEGEAYSLTKGLKLLNRGHRTDIPIYVAALGPKNVALTAEVADGWLPFPFSTEKAEEVFGPSLAEGRAKRADGLGDLAVTPFAPLFAGDTTAGLDAARLLVGFYVGGMGSRDRNFYNRLVRRYGFEEEAARIQDLFLGGDKVGAIKATPDALVDQVSLVGDEARLRDRLQAFEAAGATAIVVSPLGDGEQRAQMLRTLARANA